MLPVVVVKINYILNMDNNNYDKPLTTTAVNANSKTCVCCGKTFPLNDFNFKKYIEGYSDICITCQRKVSDVNVKLKNFTSSELIDELVSRGYKGELKYVKTVKL